MWTISGILTTVNGDKVWVNNVKARNDEETLMQFTYLKDGRKSEMTIRDFLCMLNQMKNRRN